VGQNLVHNTIFEEEQLVVCSFSLALLKFAHEKTRNVYPVNTLDFGFLHS
jgi:hypothetical protein